LGNGRICWHCNERNYGDCLGSANLGDPVRHGAGYCTGEDYFCYISERRTIRHDGNDWNWEMGQPWSPGTPGVTTYQEENIATNSNILKTTNIRVEMGCQQPMACLRQLNMNYKIEMGLPFHVNAAALPLGTLPPGHGQLAREGLCRLGEDWLEYASGEYGAANSNWRMGNWQAFNSDRRYGATKNHHHYGKGTESVCHFCCDPLIEFAATGGNVDPFSPYDYNGCNANAFVDSSSISTGGSVDSAGNVASNLFLNRAHVWDTPVWNNQMQYHGMFRNPHTQFPRKVAGNNVPSSSLAHPNA